MAIPKAPMGEAFGYDFQYLIGIKEPEGITFFLDSYLYEPVVPPITEQGEAWISAEDLRRIYAPYMAFRFQGSQAELTYTHPLAASIRTALAPKEYRQQNGVWYLRAAAVLNRCMGKDSREDSNALIVAVDGKQPVQEAFPSPMALRPHRSRLHGKAYGEQNFSLWMEEANRVIPYRMYIPFSYRAGVPQKTIVCFHGGDANADYMFRHTDNAICRYAEKYGFLLLALTSYRKYTFFGASKVPTGMDSADPRDPNPCGLTAEEQEWCQVAEKSVLLQMEDAAKRYTLDQAHLYALGNSGGCLGIFQQVKVLPAGFFRRVVCSGGMPTVTFLDPALLREKGTRFLLLMSTEDVFDGQYTWNVGYPYLKEHGVPVEFCPVGGGSHLLGWTKALEEIYSFFEKDSRP